MTCRAWREFHLKKAALSTCAAPILHRFIAGLIPSQVRRGSNSKQSDRSLTARHQTINDLSAFAVIENQQWIYVDLINVVF